MLACRFQMSNGKMVPYIASSRRDRHPSQSTNLASTLRSTGKRHILHWIDNRSGYLSQKAAPLLLLLPLPELLHAWTIKSTASMTNESVADLSSHLSTSASKLTGV